MDTLIKQARNFSNELTEWRRCLHEQPETGFEEYHTSQFVQEKLKELGYEPEIIAKTGVVAVLKGQHPGRTVALRADMDALPIPDEKTTAYASKIEGKAHLCGHDGHTTMLIGAARLLKDNPPEKGTIKFIFQPAEEGLFGAQAMIEEGVLEHPEVDVMAGLHVNPDIETGQVTCAQSEACAAADFFNLEIIGSGGHAAHPHKAADSITITAEIISSLQQLVSRQINPLSPTVLTIGQIHGGTADNAIAPKVKAGGTVRTLDPEVRYSIEERMEQLIRGICQAFGVEYRLNYKYFYPPLVNDQSLLPSIEKSVERVLGKESFSVVKPSMGGEDFSFYAEKVPAIFFRIGVRSQDKRATYPLHHPLFDLDEEALPNGSAILADWALSMTVETQDYINNL
ncbi:M20 metallopeptidase family protein [Halobacillus naozhouensis]|uniref:M20 family metallopeptidase n=1 Tax=Halobacillus naozhouensis TaxID=554880 RepID=A0ABY8IVK5_9BACI|nr:M20 family metallopeptidase [Halobacillus naozhouensis]WFT73238.1 M20 family metallopeptidase [Halobacillus naozhouensis]